MVGSTKHRHSEESCYQRGAETRARIIAAAIRLFAERGFEGASTRDIATSAGVNAPALQYYFDNKEGVYVACVEHIAARIWETMAAAVGRAEAALRDNLSDTELIEAFCEVQAQLAENTAFSSAERTDWRLMMAHQQAGLGPTVGFQITYEKVSQRMFRVSAGIVARLLGRSIDDDETKLRTMALNGQLLVFHVMRRTALTTLNWKAIGPGEVAQLKRIITDQVRILLRGLAARRERTEEAHAVAGATTHASAG
jgi:AcrR family transcriptional regulator